MSDPEVIRPRATTDVRVWSRFVVPGGIKALQDYPGHKGSVEALRAVASYALSKPQEWRVMLDREAGRIIAFERIVQQRDTSQHGRLNWWKRNLRTIRDGLRDLRGPVARPGASLRE